MPASSAANPLASSLPDDVWRATQQVLGHFAGRTSFFAEWHEPGRPVDPADADQFALWVNVHQLAIWFLAISSKFGTLASDFVREGTVENLRRRAGDNAADHLSNCIRFGHHATRQAAQLTGKSVSLEGEDLPIPFSYALALFFLGAERGFHREQTNLGSKDMQLAQCIEYVRLHSAQEVTSVVQQLIFRPESVTSYVWRGFPGAHEHQLMRRSGNVFHPVERRTVTPVEVFRARQRDQGILDRLQSKVEEIHALMSAEEKALDPGFVFRLREEIDNTVEEVIAAEGDNARLLEALKKMRMHIMGLLRSQSADSPLAVKTLDDALAASADHKEEFAEPFLLQIFQGYVPEDEMVASVFHEGPTTARVLVNVLRKAKQFPSIRDDVRSMYREVQQRGDATDAHAQVLAVFESHT